MSLPDWFLCLWSTIISFFLLLTTIFGLFGSEFPFGFAPKLRASVFRLKLLLAWCLLRQRMVMVRAQKANPARSPIEEPYSHVLGRLKVSIVS